MFTTYELAYRPFICLRESKGIWKPKESTGSFLEYITISTIANREVGKPSGACCLY